MMTKLKHNKKRNTAFLYEAIIKEATKAIIQGDQEKKKKIFSLIKENFKKDSCMKKELLLYKSLLETDGLQLRTAEKLLYEIKKDHEKIDKKKLFNEQTRFINKINKEISKNVFNNFVPSYKSLATIYQIFNSEHLTSKERVLLEESVFGDITSTIVEGAETEEMKPIDNIIYGKFVERFNLEYENLYEEQKTLLQHVIGAVSDEKRLELNIFLNEEIGNMQEKLVFVKDTITDLDLRQKVGQVVETLKNLSSDQMKKEEYLKILQIQELVREITE